MIFSVIWIKPALDELADLWNNAADRQDVADAANRIDASLRVNPYSHSESREENLRIAFAPPLAVLFDIRDADRLVQVRAVWRPV